MRLVKARVQGFQSFSDTGEVEFANGINLIIGQNNAGKSSFMRALLPELPDDRHRTPENWELFKLALPEITLTVDVSGAEIREWLLRSESQQFVPVTQQEYQDVGRFMCEFFKRSSIILCVHRHPGTVFSASYPSHKLFSIEGLGTVCALAVSTNGELRISPVHSQSDSLPYLLWGAWQKDMFYFAPERMTVGTSGFGHAVRLLPNASNLPNVLHTLYTERWDVFEKLVRHLREIFPTVGNLSVGTRPGDSQLEVRVWPTEARERVELSFPLNSSGTGVSQVIALLTAIMTIDNAVIIIDEINSFLHPAAVKAVLRILQTRYAQHQYVISTHAPEVIGFTNPSTVHLVKRSGYESSIERLDLAEVGKFREVAEHLGVSMADVFAAERVIWVEGPTEELCFPFLYQNCIGPLPRGTIFTSVAATGDFNTKKRDPAIVYEIYQRLCSAAATLVVSVAFSFDTERLTEVEKANMQGQAGGLLHFLPRRHLECYLVDPDAITAFIISKDPASAETVTRTKVEIALQQSAAQSPLHITDWEGDITDPNWLARVDAAKLITTVCGILSEHKAPFEKKNDSLFLLRYIVEHDPKRLSPLQDYVASLVKAIAQD